MKILKINQGFSLIEVLISTALIILMLGAVSSVYIISRQASSISTNSIKASFLAREYIEEVKNIRRDDWGHLVNGRYIVQQNGPDLELVTTVNGETVDHFTRYVDIVSVYRDTNGTIVETPGLEDHGSKYITVTVTWAGVPPGSLSETLILTRYKDNLSWDQTTIEEFEDGTHNGTTTLDSGDGIDGEVILGAGGGASWCNPADAISSSLDYPGSAVARALSAIEGRAFAGTGKNGSGLPFANIGISDTKPPGLSIEGTFTAVSPPKTNGVFGEEDYAYVATDDNNAEIVIIDLTTDPYSESGNFNPSGNNKGSSVYVVGTVGYMTTQNVAFKTFDLSSKTGSRSELDSVDLAGEGLSIHVIDDYAYVSVDSTTTQMQIIDVSDPSDISIIGSSSLTTVGGRDVFVNETQTRAYVVTASSSNPEFFIVDITDKSDPQLVSGGTYDTGGMSPNGLRVVPSGRAIIVGEGTGERYQVLIITDENNPVYCGGFFTDDEVYDVDTVLESDGDAWSYIVTSDSNAEFQVLEGGPGGAVVTSGIFDSQVYDVGYNAGYNRFEVSYDKPAQTNIRFQVAMVDPGPTDCSDADFNDFNFWGPGGSSASYYSDSGSIPTDNDGLGFENPARCLKVRAYLDTNESSISPTLYEFSVNYSP